MVPDETPPCPPEAVAAAETLCGGPVELKSITDRRGSAVWKATGPAGPAAVKAGFGEGAQITAREAEVLGKLPEYNVDSGTHEGTVWMVTPWFEGPSTWGVFKTVRETGEGLDTAKAGAVTLCRTVAALHESGWVHSDLQPAHGVHTPDGVRLLDLSWAWKEDFVPGPEFRGGIVHLVAPELAASINVGIMPVTPSKAAEVYALAGSLWTCITGRWPLDYKTAGIDTKEIGPAKTRAHIANRRIPLDTSTPWPAVQDVLRPVLLGGPGDRPTAAELGDLLAAL
ncbi:hypothetical protein ACFXDJ_06790 [Streptomyces sp. NPDC059443]|uniref:hypothetical protein n=1 Tax=unclassified Streptomyces TaxID=2593676 RepID=UPI0036C9B353